MFKGLALSGMSQVELSRSLQLADENEDGTVSSAELEAFGDTLKTKLTNGQDPEKLYAQLSAKALKAGGAESTGAELATLEKLFEEYNIAKSAYTPTEGDTDTAEGLAKYKPLIEAGVPLLQGLLGSKANTPTGTFDSAQQAQVEMLQRQLALQSAVSSPASPPPSVQEMARLAGFPLGFTGLNGRLFNPLFPSQVLPTNAFGGNPLLAGSAGLPTALNPLSAGSNNLNLLPQQPFAQTNFVPSVPVAPAVAPSGFAFTPTLTTPPVATVGAAPVNPAVDPWATAGSTAGAVPLNLSSVPAPPTLLAQALPQVPAQPPVQTTANGGW
jgi:hypothetical protein